MQDYIIKIRDSGRSVGTIRPYKKFPLCVLSVLCGEKNIMENVLPNLKHKIIITAFLFMLAAAGIAYADDTTTKTSLPNGLTILAREDSSMDLVAINILVDVGLKQEESATFGATNLVKALIFTDSSNNIAGKLEYYGTVIAVDATPDYLQITCITNKENFANCVGLLYEGISTQKFTDADVDQIKSKILKILTDPNNNFGTIYDYFLQVFYQSHPYRYMRLGTSTSIKNINGAALENFYHYYFVPNNMVISVCGDINKISAVKMISQKFSNMNPNPLGLRKLDWDPPAKENTIYLGIKSNTAHVMVGLPAPSFKSPDYPIMLLIKTYLADGTSSRIWTQIREKEALAYDLGGIFPRLEGPSHFIIYVVTDPEHTPTCKKKIINEINNLKNNMLSEDVLQKVKEKTYAKYILERESISEKSTNTGVAELFELNYSYDDRIKDKIMNATAVDIQRVANDYFFAPTIIIAKPSMSIYDAF